MGRVALCFLMLTTTAASADCWRPGCGRDYYNEGWTQRETRPMPRYDREETRREREDREIYNRQRGYEDDDPRGRRRYLDQFQR